MTNHWTSPRTFSQESPPPPGLAISTTVPFYDDSFRCHAGRLPDVDMATGGNEALFDSDKKSTRFLFFACGYIFAAYVFLYLKPPVHSYFLKFNQTLDFINLFSEPNQVFKSVDGKKSLRVD